MTGFKKRGQLWLAKELAMDEPKPTEIVGYSGLQAYSGVVTEEWHQKLRGQYGVKVYREMSDNDAVVGAILYAIESLTRQVTWRVEPANDDPVSQQWRDFVETCKDDMSTSWDDLMSEVLTMLIYGWSYFELVYKVRRGPGQEDARLRSDHADGKIGWRKVSLRAQDTLSRWHFQEDGGIVAMEQQTYDGKRACIPIEKALLFRTRSHKNNPEGYSILRRAFRSWYIKKRLEEVEAVGMERDLTGLPVMEVPPDMMLSTASNSDSTLRNDLLKLVQQIRRDEREGIVIPAEIGRDGQPTGYKFRLATSGGTRAIPIGDAIKRYEARIAMSVLAEVIFLGIDGGGNRALGEAKIDLFLTALNTFLGSIESTLNRFAIPRLMQLNGVPREAWPRFVHGDLAEQEAKDLADIVVKLSSAGALDMDQTLKDHLREKSGMPLPQEAEDEDQSKLPQGTVSSSTALDGGQVDGLLQIIQNVTLGQIPRESGVQLIVAAYPFSGAQAEAIIGAAGTPAFQPAMDAALEPAGRDSVPNSVPNSDLNSDPSSDPSSGEV